MPSAPQQTIRLSMLGAAATMAFQVAGKAARDALFLSTHRPSQLPLLVVAAALTAIILSLVQSRILTRVTPGRYIPLLILFSAALQTGEYLTWNRHPDASSIAVYIHVVALGALITSGFWSVVNEQFDPWSAKQAFAKIAGAGTAGGVAGGFVAERIAVMAAPETVLVAMALMQCLTAVCLFALPAPDPDIHDVGDRKSGTVRVWDLLRGSAYFRELSLLVMAGTFSAALLDYVLKADARHALGPGEPLLRFFAMFHTATALISFVLQIGATAPLLSRLGLGATVSTLPASVAFSGAAAALTGSLPVVVIARGIEAIVRGSFFRAGYELLYTPMLPTEKRAIKSFNDVTADRLGDALGGGFAQGAILLGPGISSRVMLLVSSAVAVTGWALSKTLNRGYVRSLERSLEHYSEDEAGGDDPGLSVVRDSRPVHLLTADEHRAALGTLMNGDTEAMQALLAQPIQPDRAMIAFLVPLMMEPALRAGATRILQRSAATHVGQISDYLLDPTEPLPIRRQIPLVLATNSGSRAVEALLAGLHDRDGGVRNMCARALDYIQTHSNIYIDHEPVYSAIRRELRRASAHNRPQLEHIFVLLALVLSREHVRIAYDALVSGQQHLQGIAREYIESALPTDISDTLLGVLIPQPVELG